MLTLVEFFVVLQHFARVIHCTLPFFQRHTLVPPLWVLAVVLTVAILVPESWAPV